MCGGPAPASPSGAAPLPRPPRSRQLAEAERGRERELRVVLAEDHIVEEPLGPREPQPVGAVADEPAPDAAPAQSGVDVQLPDLAPAREARERAAAGEVRLHLEEADDAAVELRREAGRVGAERAADGQPVERRGAAPR